MTVKLSKRLYYKSFISINYQKDIRMSSAVEKEQDQTKIEEIKQNSKNSTVNNKPSIKDCRIIKPISGSSIIKNIYYNCL